MSPPVPLPTENPVQNPSENDLEAEIVEEEEGDGNTFEQRRKPKTQTSTSLKRRLEIVRIVDVVVQVFIRIVTTIFFYILLLIQNYYVFTIVANVLKANNPNAIYLEPVLALIVPSTLAETYYITVKIVDWALTPINYDVKQ